MAFIQQTTESPIRVIRLRLIRPPTRKTNRRAKERILVGLGVARVVNRRVKWKLNATVLITPGQRISLPSVQGALIAVKSLIQIECLDSFGDVVTATRSPAEVDDLAPTLERWLSAG